MEITAYQKKAARTLISKPDFAISDEQVMISWNAIGIAGEAGEVLELIKKGIYHQQGIDIEKLKKELGDLIWYIAGLSTTLGIQLEDVLKGNLHKLEIRYPQGYTAEDSRKRVDIKRSTKKKS